MAAATVAEGQSLKLPTAAFAGAAAADWVSTAQALNHPFRREANPLLHFAGNKPLPTVAAGAAMDAAGVWAWTRFVGRNHPRLAAAGLYAAAAFRGSLALRNARLTARTTHPAPYCGPAICR